MKRKSLIINVLFVVFFSSTLFISCEKDDSSDLIEKNEIVLTAKQIQQKENLNSIALTVADIADSKEIFNEIHSAVNVSLTTGLDEQYRFKDILYPSESKIPSLKSSKTSDFGIKFKNAIQTNSLKSSSLTDIETFILNEDVQIYWPYSEEWDGVAEPVITFDPILDVSENIGFKRVLQEDGSIRIDTVIVNDDFAFNNPVWIINFCETEEAEIESNVKSAQLKSSSSIHQLAVGYVKSTKHYDNIFNGGDEYKFCIIGGKITSMSTAESFEGIQTINISRKDIRKKNWKKFYYELDDDWKVSTEDKELGRKFGLIEFDKKKTTRELKFEPKVTIDKVTVSLGSYTIKTESSEGWIKTDTYEDRDQMIRYQKTDMGHGLKDGYRIYGAGGVYWTLPIREF